MWDLNDGDMDMILHFDTQEVGFSSGDTVGHITGKTVNGIFIHGEDSVRILK